MAIGAIASIIVYGAYNYLALLKPFRSVDDTLGVIYTHGFAGLVGGLLTGVLATSRCRSRPACRRRRLASPQVAAAGRSG